MLISPTTSPGSPFSPLRSTYTKGSPEPSTLTPNFVPSHAYSNPGPVSPFSPFSADSGRRFCQLSPSYRHWIISESTRNSTSPPSSPVSHLSPIRSTYTKGSPEFSTRTPKRVPSQRYSNPSPSSPFYTPADNLRPVEVMIYRLSEVEYMVSIPSPPDDWISIANSFPSLREIFSVSFSKVASDMNLSTRYIVSHWKSVSNTSITLMTVSTPQVALLISYSIPPGPKSLSPDPSSMGSLPPGDLISYNRPLKGRLLDDWRAI